MLFIALALAAAVAEPPPEPMSVEVIRDPITDTIRAFATLREHRNRLVVSCDPNRYSGTRVAFHAERWLARGNLFSGERPIVYRFDNGRAHRTLWDVEDRHGTLTGRSRVAQFLNEMVAADKLVIRARDIENHRMDLTFRLKDVRPALEQLAAACAASPRERRDPLLGL